MSSTPPIIVSFGRTKAGKSWMGNQLTQLNTFTEGDDLESETTQIKHAVAWNGDLFCDVPGYFDSMNRDEIQQANFVDHLSNKTIRVILFIFTDGMDNFTKTALEAFSDYKSNILLVVNKDNPLQNRGSDIKDYQGHPLLYIQMNQTSFEVLKLFISSKHPVKCERLLTPVSLFKQPITIVSVEDAIRVFKSCGNFNEDNKSKSSHCGD
jgi:GTP-binding protein EngB required for normal cell division